MTYKKKDPQSQGLTVGWGSKVPGKRNNQGFI